MKHLGDITKIDGHNVPLVDIVCGGSPCQDLSVAGKRAGLAGERSGLFMEQMRLIKEMRDESFRQLSVRGTDVDIRHIQPRYMVWENVPGAFSSNQGEDFRAVLEEVCRVKDKAAVVPMPRGGRWSTSGCIMGNGWSVAWRVHDAQFWGVPQRRKRISLVADFGGTSAPEILFERKGLSGDSEQSGEEREEASRPVERDTYETISFQERAGCEGGARESLYSTNEQEPCQPSITNPSCLNPWDVQSKHIQPENGKAEALYSGECRGGGGESYVMQEPVYCLQGNGIDRADTAGCNGKGWRENESYTLNTIDRPAIAYRKQGHPQNKEQGQGWERTDTNDTLNAFDSGEGRTPTLIRQTYQEQVGTIDCCIAKGTSNQLANQDMFIANGAVVRRLTPMECERLQGFPDGWTDIGEWVDSKGKKHKDADSPRYKALGNSIALPYWSWMANRMVKQLKDDGVEHPTMASLFDGIGGFPLVYSRCGCKPVWASEIEEFPIAVTKIRFPEEGDTI